MDSQNSVARDTSREDSGDESIGSASTGIEEYFSDFNESEQSAKIATRIAQMMQRIEGLRPTINTYIQSDNFPEQFSQETELEIRAEQDIINNDQIGDLLSIMQSYHDEPHSQELGSAAELSTRRVLNNIINNLRLEQYEGPHTVEQILDHVTQQIESIQKKPELEEIEYDEETQQLMADAARLTDERQDYQLIPAEKLLQKGELEEKLRQIDKGIGATLALFKPKKTDEVLGQLKFLVDCLYLFPEKDAELVSMFAAHYVRVCATEKEELGLVERMEQYVIEEMGGEELDIEIPPEEPEEELDKSINARIARNYSKIFTVGCIALGMGFVSMAGGNEILIGLGGAGGILFEKGMSAFFRLAGDSTEPPDYFPGILQEKGSNPYGTCTKEYSARVKVYRGMRTEFIEKLSKSSRQLFESIQDDSKKQARGIKPEPEFTQQFSRTYSGFMSNLKSILESSEQYPIQLTKRSQVCQQIEVIRTTEDYLREQS